MTQDQITILLPIPPRELSPNARVHWAKRARATKGYRQDAFFAAIHAAKGGNQKWDKATMRATFYYTDRRRRDIGNAEAALKPAIDGIVDAGLITDDRATVLRHEPSDIQVDPDTTPHVVITLTRGHRADKSGTFPGHLSARLRTKAGQKRDISGTFVRTSADILRTFCALHNITEQRSRRRIVSKGLKGKSKNNQQAGRNPDFPAGGRKPGLSSHATAGDARLERDQPGHGLTQSPGPHTGRRPSPPAIAARPDGGHATTRGSKRNSEPGRATPDNAGKVLPAGEIRNIPPNTAPLGGSISSIRPRERDDEGELRTFNRHNRGRRGAEIPTLSAEKRTFVRFGADILRTNAGHLSAPKRTDVRGAADTGRTQPGRRTHADHL